MTTGERIKAARKKVGITQAELAKRLGISYVGISQWENNLRRPKQETLKRIADALGIRLFDLLPEETREEFSVLSDYFNVKDKEIAKQVEEVEEILIGNVLREELFEQLYSISLESDKVINDLLNKKRNELTDEFLKETLNQSFDCLNRRGKFEVVTRVAELTQIKHFRNDSDKRKRSKHSEEDKKIDPEPKPEE